MPSFPTAGLYAITDAGAPLGVVEATREVLRGGARVIQYRDKSTDTQKRTQEAAAIAGLCAQYSATFIVNDDAELALEVAADGVHVGRSDASLEEARKLLGPARIVGVSCYGSLEIAASARAGGANYIAFGRFYESATKPDATPASIDVLTTARERFDLPVVAIGGITPQNGTRLVEAGADFLAVISALYGSIDPYRSAMAFRPCFDASSGISHSPPPVTR